MIFPSFQADSSIAETSFKLPNLGMYVVPTYYLVNGAGDFNLYFAALGITNNGP